VIVDVKKAELIFNRTNDLQKKEGIRKCNLKSVTQKKLELHIYLDSSSIEIFSDDYATAMTNTFYLPGEEKGLTIEAVKGKTFFTQITVWNMKEI
uniref:GH32 C-terminal domain-containing protein n=1 Tax=uncultured Blautia sp. TaxID=765821 RepID=UPI00280B20D6